MLSNLASYLGYAATSAKTTEAEKAPAEMWLRAVEEDEWVLVERNEKEDVSQVRTPTTTTNEVDDDAEMTRVTLMSSTHPGCLPVSSKALSRSASFDVLNPLQESWYLTPPPSFTSEGPVHMETSPLENLLIEHPSMSVYERTPQPIDTPRKMSNSSPSNAATTEEERAPVMLMPIKERMYKLSRNKINANVFKKQTSASSPTDSSVPLEIEERKEVKETKIKNFVKSPRRSINSELQNFPKKAYRKRSDTSSGSTKMISASSEKQNEIREEVNPVISNVPRRLYSEVLANKPEAPTVQTSSQVSTSFATKEPQLKTNLKPVPETSNPPDDNKENGECSMSEESVMSIEESSTDEGPERPEEKDCKKVVQTQPDRQHRLHCLTRSAQKVEQRKTYDVMKKNPLIRTNKAREFNFRNKRQRRADMMQRHSGANNNRKCAKTVFC